MEQNENTLSVLKIAPGQYPQQVEIDNDLKALQQAVGGSIGASYPFEDPVAIDELDKVVIKTTLLRKYFSRSYTSADGGHYHQAAGTVAAQTAAAERTLTYTVTQDLMGSFLRAGARERHMKTTPPVPSGSEEITIDGVSALHWR